jgi:hypothetical protein
LEAGEGVQATGFVARLAKIVITSVQPNHPSSMEKITVIMEAPQCGGNAPVS